MKLSDIVNLIIADRGPIVLALALILTVIEITPLKLNPWGALFNWVGRQLNREVLEKIDRVETRLDTHIRESEKAELRIRRTTILDFSSSVIRGVNYHKEKFDFMIAECDSYEAYCKDNNIKNGVAEASIAEIRRIYQEHLRNGDFLDSDAEFRGTIHPVSNHG